MVRNKWDSTNVPEQKGRVVIVTGSSSGIGYETARVLAEKKAIVIIAVRNQSKGDEAVEKIKAENPGADVNVMLLDLADLKSVKDFSVRYHEKYAKLDLLINNAGVMIPPYSKTSDGFELQFGTNHLGHFALTGQLLDLIQKTPGSRIVNVSSAAHKNGNINFDDLNWEKRKYRAWNAYGDSKIANLYFTSYLTDNLKGDSNKPIVASAHPGWTATELQRNSGFVRTLNNFFAQDITMGALPTLYAALGEDVKSGDYYGPSGFMEMKGYAKKVRANALAKDKNIAEKLWKVSENLTGVKMSF